MRRGLIRRLGSVLVILPILAAAPGAADAAKAPKKPVKPGVKPVKPAPKLKRAPRAFFGVQSYEALSSGELEVLRKARVGTQRTMLYWHAVEPTAGARDWSYSDYEVGAAARAGLRVFPCLYGMTAAYGTHVTQPPIYSDTALGAWRAFAADAVRRYGPGGEFWRQNPSVPYAPLTTWQVWNEPSNPPFWNGPPVPADYARLVQETSGAIKSADPAAQVVLAGMLPNDNEPTGIPLPHFLGAMYGVPGMKAQFDGVAVHPYSLSAKKTTRSVERARRVMDRNGDRKTPLWVTEVGWSTGGTQGDWPMSIPPQAQARNLRKAYGTLLERRAKLRLKGVIWFSMRDITIAGSDHRFQHMGLFDAGKQPKPAWRALARMTRGQASAIVEPPAAPPPPPPPPPPPRAPASYSLFADARYVLASLTTPQGEEKS